MTLSRPSLATLGRLGVLAALLLFPAGAVAHGGAETGAGAMTGQAEIKQLSMQPARVLAQQALAELRVRGDVHEAGVRLDAALESKDRGDVDIATLRRATETLDSGHAHSAIPLIDEALSRPLGSDKGKALHEAGREFQPGTGPQEIVAIALGGALLLIGAFALWRNRRVAARS